MKKIGIIILAAGGSSRLGTPKQLLKKGGKTLIDRVCEIATSIDSTNVFVVLGAHFDKVKETISNSSIVVLKNLNWEEGIASSIRIGIQKLKMENFDAAVLLPCDQIHLTHDILRKLIQNYIQGHSLLVYSNYNDRQFGAPLIFDKELFNELIELTGNSGTKSIVQRNLENSQSIRFPGGEIDVDSKEDLKFVDSIE
ncbi:MAG: nucleotidyltransferase family protein [Pyrinomonadaceae bacterium]|nr:nucleotidyltransferase family protein [Sphingobacteriaceae bacterium]